MIGFGRIFLHSKVQLHEYNIQLFERYLNRTGVKTMAMHHDNGGIFIDTLINRATVCIVKGNVPRDHDSGHVVAGGMEYTDTLWFFIRCRGNELLRANVN